MPEQNHSESQSLLEEEEGDASTMNEETVRLTQQNISTNHSYGSNNGISEVSVQGGATAPAGSETTTASPVNRSESVEEQAGGGPYGEAVEDVVTSLARRVRCLFSVITWPIVPLGTIASLALIWLIYASAVLDVGKTCSHPLHWYAILSLVLVLYAPYHARIRSLLFNYQRERGSERPPSVRRYDQLFHTLALIYVYAGITLVQTCRDDVAVLTPDNDDKSGDDSSSSSLGDLSLASGARSNTCAATCPNLFLSLRVYVATIEIFTFSLILPLLFLPCLYLYFIRRTMQDAESLAVLQDRFREEEALMRNGGVTEQEIMEQFVKVRLVVDPNSNEERRVVVVPEEPEQADGASSSIDLGSCEECRSKECCICMESFQIQEDEEATTTGGACDDESLQIIRATTCGHLFHRSCMGSWVSGRWQQSTSNSDNPSSEEGGRNRESSRRARRTTCPLCRRDVRPNR